MTNKTKVAIIGVIPKEKIDELMVTLPDVEFVCVDSIGDLPEDEACSYTCYTESIPEMQIYPPEKLVKFAEIKIDKAYDSIEQEPRNRKERRIQAAEKRKAK